MILQRAHRLGTLAPIALLAALAGAPGAARGQDAETNILPTEAPSGEGSGPFTALGQSASANLFTGEATLSLPLRVPPSRGEVTPKLQLAWSSSGSDGPFGHGWSLGLGAIARSKREGVPDCGPEAPIFTLHLPGASVELVREAGSSRWYARVDEGFVEAVADEGANQWLVRDRAGRTYHFGTAPEARAWKGDDVFLEGGAPPYECHFTAFWALTRIEDPNGNTVDFRYARTGNAPRIAEIGYGANPSAGLAEHPFRVEFEAVARDHPQRSRSLGVPQEFGELVAAIRVLYRRSAADPALYLDRQYELDYEQLHGGGAYLVEVREVAPEGEHEASLPLESAPRIEVPPRRFDYDLPSVEQPLERFRPDPLGDDSFFLSQGSDGNSRFRVLHDTLDMNGDGIADAVDAQHSSDHWRVLPGTGEGFDAGAEILWYVGFLPAGERALSKTRRESGRNKLHYDTVDLTGDGVPDWVDARGTPWLVHPGRCTSAVSCQFGAAGEAPLVWPAPNRYLSVVSITHSGRGSVTRRALMDTNGDGRPDYVQVGGANQAWEVFRGTGQGFEAVPTPFAAAGWLAIAGPWYPADPEVTDIVTVRRVFDMNGDALPDLVSVDTSEQWRLAADGSVVPESACPGCPVVHALEVGLNDGRGFEAPIRSALGEPVGTGTHHPEAWLSHQFTENGPCTVTRTTCPERTTQDFSDVNGDGLPDYVVTKPGHPLSGYGDDDFVQLNLGGGRIDPALTPIAYPGYVRDRITGRGDGHRWTRSTGDLMDLDGDGLLDAVKADADSGEWCAVSFSAFEAPLERPGLLRAAHDGVGGALRFRYAPSSSFDHGGADGVEDLPFSRWVVTAIAQSDGLCATTPADPFDPEDACLVAGHGRLRRFAYADGLFDVASREFRGFGAVWETDAYGNETETVFSQADHTRGKMLSQTVRAVAPDGARHDVRALHNRWEVLPSALHPERMRVWLSETETREHSVPHDPARLLCTLSRNEAPDEYGRVSTSCSADCASAAAATGCQAVPGQVRTDTVWADPVAGAHLRERPERVTSRWTDASGATRLLGDKRMRYDGDGDTPLAAGRVSRGNVRVVESWLDRSPLDPAFTPGWQTPGVRMDYDAYGNLVATTDPRGHATRAVYADGTFAIHPVVQRAPDTGGAVHASFVETSLRFGEPTRVVDPNGQTTERRYDGLGRLVCEALPGDTLADCHSGGPLTATRELHYFFGVPGHAAWALRLSRVEVRVPNAAAPAGHNIRAVFRDAMGRERFARVERSLAGDDPAAAPSFVVEDQVGFDAEGRPRVRYAPYTGFPVEAPSEVGATWLGYALGDTGAIDPLGRASLLDPPGPERLEVAHGGRLRVAVDATGATTVGERDAFGRSVREERFGADGSHLLTTQRFDGAGRVIERQVGGADGDPATTVFSEYDSLGRLVEKRSPDSDGPWRYGYDAAGNLVYRDDPKPGQHVQQVHDALGRLLRVCSHAGDAFDPGVDADSCGAGVEVAVLRYDEADAANGIGRLTTASDAHGSERFHYDARGRVASSRRWIDGASAELAYAYDSADRLVSVRYPGWDERAHAYDASGQLVAIEGVVDDIDYDLLGRPSAIARSNGTSDVYDWYGPEDAHRLRGIRTHVDGAPGAPLYDVEYGYDALGKVASIRDLAHGSGSELSSAADLVYDGLGRLLRVEGSRADEDFAFDALGNLLRRQGEALEYAGAGPHQATAHGQTAIGYTANGERAWKSGPAEDESYGWDALGRLVRIEIGGDVVRFGYDYAGRLLVKTVNGEAPVRYFGERAESRAGVLTKHFFAGDRLLASSHDPLLPGSQAGAAPIALEGDWLVACWTLVMALLCGAGLRRRPHAAARARVRTARALGASALLVVPGLTLALPPPASAQCAWAQPDYAGMRHYHVDHLGSTQLVTDETGAVRQQIRYDAYGVVRWREGPAGPAAPDPSMRREFTGYEREPLSGLLHAGARFYDPALGQFLSHDPAEQFPSPYAYGPGDPANGTDPSGALFGIDDLIALLVIASVLASIASVAHAFVSGGPEAGIIALTLAGVTAGAGYGVGAAGASVAAGGVIHAAAEVGSKPLVQVALLGSSTGMTVASLAIDGDTPEALAIASYVLAGVSIGLAFAARSSDAANGIAPGGSVGRPAGLPRGGKELVRVTGGSAAERAELEADLADVFGTERGAELLDLASKRSSPLEIRINRRGLFYYDSRRDFITVDPSRKIDVLVWKGWRPGWQEASMRRILAHELGHALTGIRDVGPFRLDNIRANENPIVNELGEPSRIWY